MVRIEFKRERGAAFLVSSSVAIHESYKSLQLFKPTRSGGSTTKVKINSQEMVIPFKDDASTPLVMHIKKAGQIDGLYDIGQLKSK